MHKSVPSRETCGRERYRFAALKGGKGGMGQLNHASWIPDRFGRADARSSPPPPRAVALAVRPPIRSHRRLRLSPSLGRGAPRFREERGDELRGFDGPIAALHHRRDDCAGGVGWWWGVKAQTVAMTAGAE